MKPPFTQMQPGPFADQQQNYPPQPMKGGGYAAASPPAYTEGAGYMTPQPPQPPAVSELGGESSISAPTQRRGVPVYEVGG